MLLKAKCIPCGCPFVKSDVSALAPQHLFYFKRKEKASVIHFESWNILQMMPVVNHILHCGRTSEHWMHCRIYWLLREMSCCTAMCLNTTTFTGMDSAFVTMRMLKVKTSFYSAEVYSEYNYTTMQHKTNFPTMQRWCKYARLTGWDMPPHCFQLSAGVWMCLHYCGGLLQHI